jgi:hypothetical protein
MVAHPTSGAELPRIRLPERPEVEQRVNEQLDSLAGDLMCEDPSFTYHSTASVEHSVDDVFSVLVSASYYCGGPYPVDGADQSTTFDLQTGEAVRFAELFEDYERDGTAIARAFVESISAADLEGCEDVLTPEELLGLQAFSYTISTAGLRVVPTFAHVISVCNGQSTVPFDALRAFAARGGILLRVADAARGH